MTLLFEAIHFNCIFRKNKLQNLKCLHKFSFYLLWICKSWIQLFIDETRKPKQISIALFSGLWNIHLVWQLLWWMLYVFSPVDTVNLSHKLAGFVSGTVDQIIYYDFRLFLFHICWLLWLLPSKKTNDYLKLSLQLLKCYFFIMNVFFLNIYKWSCNLFK